MGIALVTGASAGIGKELARCFAADGHAVVLVARRLPLLETLAGELRARSGRDAWPIACDLAAPGGVDTLLAELARRGLEIDFLVNNAGFGTTGAFVDSPAERELAMAELNVMAVARLTRALLPGMLARRRGRILNIGSTAGFQPGPYMATYYASKAFVNHFSEALAEEARGTGVTVTLSCPGPTHTEFAEVSGVGKANLFRLPVATAERVAREAYRACFAGRVLVVHGFLNRVGVLLVRFGPRSLVRRIIAFLNRPPALGAKP
ncbi:MAG TPA: SDR family oxidoreductase [Polyangiaceae bacterium]|nr:SDR family oxidoreductase [Polyangiaceae bacterium]